MLKTKKIISIALLICITVCGCNPDDVNPSNNSNIPSRIILKEKDTNGIFQLVYDFKLYFRQDSIYFDSVQVVSPSGREATVIFDYSKFLSKNYVAVKYGDGNFDITSMEIIKFENSLIKQYIPTYNTIDEIEYDSYKTNYILTASNLFSSYENPVSGSGSGLYIWNEFFPNDVTPLGFTTFFTQVLPTETLCTATFYDKLNKTKLLSLSGQKFSNSNMLPSFNFSTHWSQGRFFIENIPFFQANMNLIKSIRYPCCFIFEDYSYEFDVNDRVKKVNIIATDSVGNTIIREQALELSY